MLTPGLPSRSSELCNSEPYLECAVSRAVASGDIELEKEKLGAVLPGWMLDLMCVKQIPLSPGLMGARGVA